MRGLGRIGDSVLPILLGTVLQRVEHLADALQLALLDYAAGYATFGAVLSSVRPLPPIPAVQSICRWPKHATYPSYVVLNYAFHSE